LIGKRYKEEKKAEGRPKAYHKLDHSDPIIDGKSTAWKIAEQSKVGEATVKRAEKFADSKIIFLILLYPFKISGIYKVIFSNIIF
jgi:hypothetical protein